MNVQPRVASADVIQKFNPNNKNALIKQYKTIYHPGEASMCLASARKPTYIYSTVDTVVLCHIGCCSKDLLTAAQQFIAEQNS